jgi:hypothetical protein
VAEAEGVAAALVGRTGADGACMLVELSPRHDAPVAQVRPFIQQPPPRLAAHENQPVEHVYAVDDVRVGVVVGVGVAEVDGEVGTTMTAVDDGRVCVGVEDGWT